MQLEHDAPGLIAVGVAEHHLHAACDRHLREIVQDRQHGDLVGARADLDAHVLRDERQQVGELGREDGRRGVGGRGEVGAATAGVGHRGQQVLAEALAEADGRRADAVGGARTGHLREMHVVGDPDVGLPVGQQQHAPGARAVLERGQHLDALQPAAGEVGRAAVVDRGDGGVQLDAVGADLDERRVQAHLVVERDDGEAVGGREPVDEERGRAPGDLELVAGHRAGAVDDERQRERPAFGGGGSRGSGQLEQARDVVLLLDGEQLVFEAHGSTHEGESSFFSGAVRGRADGDGWLLDATVARRCDTNVCSNVTPVTAGGRVRAQARLLPLISRSRGLSIYLYYDDHAPPHYHVRSTDGDAVVLIRTGRVEGRLPPRQRALVERWRKEHLMELHLNWQRATLHEPLHAIEPLK